MTKRVSKEELEKNYEVIETKVKRDKHPNQWKYPGRSGNEHKMALLKYMQTLNKDQFGLLAKNKLISNEENTMNFFNEIKTGDLVGIKDTLYKVVSKNENSFSGEISLKNKTVEIDLPTIDFSLATGFAEILWRDDKPYGVDEEESVSFYVEKKKEEEKK